MHFLAQGPIVWEPTTGREEETAQTPEGSEVEKGEGHDNILLESLSAQVPNIDTQLPARWSMSCLILLSQQRETAMLR